MNQASLTAEQALDRCRRCAAALLETPRPSLADELSGLMCLLYILTGRTDRETRARLEREIPALLDTLRDPEERVGESWDGPVSLFMSLKLADAIRKAAPEDPDDRHRIRMEVARMIMSALREGSEGSQPG